MDWQPSGEGGGDLQIIALFAGLHYLIMLWGTKLMFRYLPVSEMGEKGQSISLTLSFLSMVKYSFSDTDCYYQVHAGGFMDPGPGNLDPHSQNCALKSRACPMFWSTYSINKNQGLTEGHRNPSYTDKGSSKTDHRLFGVLATKSLLQHYPMAESSWAEPPKGKARWDFVICSLCCTAQRFFFFFFCF